MSEKIPGQPGSGDQPGKQWVKFEEPGGSDSSAAGYAPTAPVVVVESTSVQLEVPASERQQTRGETQPVPGGPPLQELGVRLNDVVIASAHDLQQNRPSGLSQPRNGGNSVLATSSVHDSSAPRATVREGFGMFIDSDNFRSVCQCVPQKEMSFFSDGNGGYRKSSFPLNTKYVLASWNHLT